MATSFVEEAILKVNDQSSAKISKINRELMKLRRTAKGGVNIGFRGIPTTKEISNISAAVREMRKLRKVGPIKIDVSSSGLVRTINRVKQLNRELATLKGHRRQTVSASGGGIYGGGGGVTRRGNRVGSIYEAFPGNVPAVMNFAVAHMVVNAGRMTLRNAGAAALASQAEETRQRIFVGDPATRAALRNMATENTLSASRISETRANEIARDLYISGFRGSNLASASQQVTALEGQALLIAPKAADRITMLANKIGNLANITEDSVRQQQILEATYKAAIVQGESFSAPTMLAALRRSGLAGTLTEEGLVGFALAVDALGQRAGSALTRMVKELTTPLSQSGAGAGIAKGAVESLVSKGIRGTEGLSYNDQKLLNEDPIKFIQTYLAAAMQRAGVDITDRTAVRRFTARAGFMQTSQRIITDAIEAMPEHAKQRDLAARLDFAKADAAAMDDLGAAIKNLTASFETFSSRILVPIFKEIAPYVDSFAQYMERVAIEGSNWDRWGMVGMAGLGAAGTLWGTAKLTSFMMGGTKLTAAGGVLMGAGKELITAARMLMGASTTKKPGGVVTKGGKAAGGAAAGGAATKSAIKRGAAKSAIKRGVAKTAAKLAVPAAGGVMVLLDMILGDPVALGERPEKIIEARLNDARKRAADSRRLLGMYADAPEGMVLPEEKQRALDAWKKDVATVDRLDKELVYAVLNGLDGNNAQEMSSAVKTLTAIVGNQKEAVSRIQEVLRSFGFEDQMLTSPRPRPRPNPGDMANPIVEILDVPEEMNLAMENSNTKLIETANVFGPTVGEGILQFAPQIGEIIAANIRNNLVGLTIEPQLGASPANADTGSSIPIGD